MKDLIEKLKDNFAHRIFADMSDEEQDCISEAHKKGKLQVIDNDMVWSEKNPKSPIFNTGIYRIDPNYQPEPVDLEIERIGKWLGVRKTEKVDLPSCYTIFHLYHLPSLYNFTGFYLKDSNQVEVRPEWVSRYFPNVIARFRKGIE